METKRISDYKSFKISDEEVVRRILEGEKELFEVLLRRHNQILFRVIRSYLKSESDVEEIMQTAYIKAWERLSQFNAEAAFSTWLIRIAINEALMFLRKQKKNKILPMDTFSTGLKDINSTHRNMTPEMKYIQMETKHLLEQAVDHLPEKYRTVYMLREIEGLENREVAECLQISISNVKVRLHRARLLLKDALLELADRSDAFEYGSARCDRLTETVLFRIKKSKDLPDF